MVNGAFRRPHFGSRSPRHAQSPFPWRGRTSGKRVAGPRIYFAALILGAGEPSTPDYPAQAGFGLAVFAASTSWQLPLATGGALLGHVLTGPRARLVTGLVSTALITGFALHLAVPSS